MMKKDHITIHHSSPIMYEWSYYRKGKKYTYEEYCKLIRIKKLIKTIILMILFYIISIIRGYIYLEYGI